MSMTAEERASAWQEKWGSSDDLTDEAFADLILSFRAHANAALEAGAKVVCPFCTHGKPLVHDPEIGWLHQYPDDPESDSSCYAAAIRVLREEE